MALARPISMVRRYSVLLVGSLLACAGASPRRSEEPLPEPTLIVSGTGLELWVEAYRPAYKCGRRSKRLPAVHYRAVLRRDGGETETIDLGPAEYRIELAASRALAVAVPVSEAPVTTLCGAKHSPQPVTIDLRP